MRRDFPHPCVFLFSQHQTRAVVLVGNGYNGRGRPQGIQCGNQQGRRSRGNGSVGRGNMQPSREVSCQDDKA